MDRRCFIIKFVHMQINTCNGMRCGETFGGPNSPNKPSLWTENWTSLYAFRKSLHYTSFCFSLFLLCWSGGEVEEIGSNSLGLDKRLTLEGH
jgi:hypothetical protein